MGSREAVALLAAAAALSYAWLTWASDAPEDIHPASSPAGTTVNTLEDVQAKTIPELVAILDECEGSLLVEAAVMRLGDLAAFTPLQHQIAAASGITSLLDRLADMDCTRRCAAAILSTLSNLVVNDANHHVVGTQMNLELFLGWYKDNDIDVKQACARLLKNLSMWERYAAELLDLRAVDAMARDLFQRDCPRLDDTILQCWLNMQYPEVPFCHLQTMLNALEGGTPQSERAKETTMRLLLHCAKRDEASNGFVQHIVACLASLDFFMDANNVPDLFGYDELRQWYTERTMFEKAWAT
ncbi:hypothetical protein ACHHYP_04838 [Achlya hypogyna]|uniref:Secreted protein n=1 Tax=Achlya hypogyna TaxID=1202772 RepID=A0A1V9YZT5_ACHHY|nr:hypothetical protein ACHHYP_04838 [Achlya hypogyna]